MLLEKPGQELDSESWTAAQTELRARYLTACIKKVLLAREEYGATYWSIESDRGARIREVKLAGKRAVALTRSPAVTRRGWQSIRNRLNSSLG